jgi:hypothetical protein
MDNKGDRGDQATAESLGPATKEAQVEGAHDIPPPPAAAPSEELPEIHDGPRSAQPTLPSTTHLAEDFVSPIDKIMYDNTLTYQITIEHLKYISDLEKKRQEILKEAKYIKQMNEKLDKDVLKAQYTFKHAQETEEEYINLIHESPTTPSDTHD